MSVLLVDVGNSRIKWTVMSSGRLGRQRALAHGGMPRAATVLRRLFAALGTRREALSGVYVASVASAALDRELSRTCRRFLKCTPQFARTNSRAGNVRNGYREVWRLGVDRWLALIGARQHAPRRSLCVVDVGTALTLDLLDRKGRHLGGAIVPGPALMIDALLRDTGGIRRRARPTRRRFRTTGRRDGSLFARDTRGGLNAGARFAAAAVIDRARFDARVRLGAGARLGAMPLRLLTGGGAESLRGLLRSPHRLIPDLVLRGLAVLAAADLC